VPGICGDPVVFTGLPAWRTPPSSRTRCFPWWYARRSPPSCGTLTICFISRWRCKGLEPQCWHCWVSAWFTWRWRHVPSEENIYPWDAGRVRLESATRRLSSGWSRPPLGCKNHNLKTDGEGIGEYALRCTSAVGERVNF